MAIAINHLTFNSAPTSGVPTSTTSSTGNCSVIYYSLGSAATLTSVADSAGNTYHPAANFTDSSLGPRGFYIAYNVAIGITSFTVTWSGGTAEVGCYDLSGVSTTNPVVNCNSVDSQGTYGGTATTNPIGPPIYYPASGGIVLAGITEATNSVASPFVLDSGVGNGGLAHALISAGGAYSPSWTLIGSFIFSGVSLILASTLQTPNARYLIGHGSATGTYTSVTSQNPLQTSVGDLVFLVGYADTGKSVATPFTDSQSNTWTMVTGMNPYSNSGEYDIYVGYCVLTSASVAHTFTFHFQTDGQDTILGIAVTPSGTPTFHTSGVGLTTPASTSHIAASCSPSIGDILFAAIDNEEGFTYQPSYSVGGNWTLGPYEQDGEDYESGCLEFQASSAGGLTTDNIITGNAITASNIMVAFSIAGGSVITNTRLRSYGTG